MNLPRFYLSLVDRSLKCYHFNSIFTSCLFLLPLSRFVWVKLSYRFSMFHRREPTRSLQQTKKNPGMERKSGILFLVRVCSVEVFLYSMTGCLTLCFSHVFSHDGGYPIQLDSDTDTSCFFYFPPHSRIQPSSVYPSAIYRLINKPVLQIDSQSGLCKRNHLFIPINPSS